MFATAGALTALIIMIGLVLVWSMFLGWVLTLILPFELFEGSLLAMFASGLGLYIFLNGPKSEDTWEDVAHSSHDIPVDRFFTSEAERTWENWAHYEVANAIAYEFKQSLKAGMLNDTQLEELAIRLSAAGIAILKRKSPRATTLAATSSQLQAQSKRMELQPYDEDIMRAAVNGINLALTAAPVEFAVRKKVWKQPAPLLDVE